jgi:murein DD-endopeptidase MepM/ murein hydrolase activator NlpD
VASQSKSERIRDLKRQIEEASRKAQAELDAIAESDKRLTEVNNLIAQTEQLVEEARRRVDEAQRVLSQAIVRVQETERKLEQATARYQAARKQLDRRVLQLYKYGRASDAEAILDSDGFEQALISRKYTQSLRERDERIAKAVAASVKDLSEIREELDQARKEAEARRDTLRSEQERLEATLAEQNQLKSALETEIATHKRILEGIEADKAKLERALDELEGQSRRIGGYVLSRGSGKGKLSWPCTGAVVSGFGMRFHPILGYARMHNGVDISCPNGAPVGSAAAGVVAYAGWSGGYGNFVLVDHGDGLATGYAHLSRIQVSTGQSVGAGATIGNVGSTGLSTGPHLHFEVRVNGTPVDPMQYF